METLDLGQKLVELGYAKASVPQDIKKNTIESQLAPAILSAETRAKNYRNGIWLENLPPLPVYVVYWRKGSQKTAELLSLTAKKLLQFLVFVSKSALIGTKNLALRPFRTPKRVQAT